MAEFNIDRSDPEFDIICEEWSARITVSHKKKTCTIFVSATSEASCTQKLYNISDREAITQARWKGLQ